MTRGRPARAASSLALAVALLFGACTGGGPSTVTPTGSPPASAPRPSGPRPKPLQPARLCRHPKASPQPAPSPTSLPASIAAVADQVEELRQLEFQRSVSPEPVSHERLVELLQAGLDQEFPPGLEARRGRAWITIGALPAGTDLRQAILDFAGTQIIGFYDTASHRLVFQGTASPSPFERMTLAHELAHALDDQAFGLDRLDHLENACRDEQFLAFLSLTEGDAVETQLRWAVQNLSGDEKAQLAREAGQFSPPPPSVPEFVQNLMAFPYVDGRAFVEALLARGGQRAVNDAFRRPPVSTEQILHPNRYPKDAPRTLSVPEIREKLGGPWVDLDVEDVGEGWLRMLLDLRLPQDTAERAAAGWDGGQYRAWKLDDRTAVLMMTVWDNAHEAKEFSDSMRQWARGHAITVRLRGSEVDILFGSDRMALDDLQRVVG